MSAREVIAKQVRWGEINPVSLSVADEIITMLNLSGHIIMKKEDVEAIRDKERQLGMRQAKYINETLCLDCAGKSGEYIDGTTFARLEVSKAIDAAIKSGGF